MPDGEYKLPTMSVGEYKRAVEVWLRKAKEEGRLQDLIGKDMDEREYLAWAEDRADLEGIHAGLPFYNELIAFKAQRAWGEENKERMFDWQREVEKLTAEDCAQIAYRLNQFSYYIQKLFNRDFSCQK